MSLWWLVLGILGGFIVGAFVVFIALGTAISESIGKGLGW